jgi:hypothetical protein
MDCNVHCQNSISEKSKTPPDFVCPSQIKNAERQKVNVQKTVSQTYIL